MGRSGAPPALGQAGSFRAARRSRRIGGRRAPVASGQGHRDPRTLEELIRQCQDAARNSYYLRPVLSAERSLTIGATPSLRPATDDDAWNAEAADLFAAWASTAEVTGQLGLWDLAGATLTAWQTDGCCFVHKVDRPDGELALEFIEGLRLRNPTAGVDTERLKSGVEIDEGGRPNAVHVASWDARGQWLTGSPVRVPIENGFLLNNYRLHQPGVVRAEPGLASVIDIVATLEAGTHGAITSYELATYLSLIWLREHPEAGGAAEQLAGAAVADGDARDEDDAHERGELGPMSQLIGDVGDKVFQFKPEHPTTAFNVMLLDMLRLIASALDMPMGAAYAYFIRNYHASRSEMSVMWPRFGVRQRVLTDRLIVPVWCAWVERAVYAGRLSSPPKGWRRPVVSLASMPVLDESTDVRVVTEAVAAGAMKPSSMVARIAGRTDFGAFVREYRTEMEMLREAGIEPGAKPVQVTASADAGTVATGGDEDGAAAGPDGGPSDGSGDTQNGGA
ncbi:MAG: phage portal protein [Planctomycetota bacterium]